MSDYLKLLKFQSKEAPITLLKLPWLLAVLPYWGVQFILGRLKNNTTIVYLTETNIDKLLANASVRNPGMKLRVVRDMAEFSGYARKRIKEDSAVSFLYYEEVKRRFNRGDFAIVGFVGGLPVSYIFICIASAVFAPVNMMLPLPRAIFGIYDVYTYEKSRGQGYYSCLFGQSVNMMRNKGFEKMWLWLMAHNQASIKVHLALGINHINKILTEKILFGITKRTVKDIEMLLAALVSK